MNKFSLLAIQVTVIVLCLVLPVLLLFGAYAGEIFAIALNESQAMAQGNLTYVNAAFELLTDTARSEAIRISASEDYISAIGRVDTYDQLIRDVALRGEIDDVVSRLATVQFADSRLRNVYLYTLDTDYILTSDRGALRKAQFNDYEWLNEYERQVNDQRVARVNTWNMRVVPEIDLLSNGSRDGETPVISYVYSVRMPGVKRLSLLVMNFYQKAIAEMINAGVADAGGRLFLIDAQGVVLCHPDDEKLGENLCENQMIGAILAGEAQSGYLVEPGGGLMSAFAAQDRTLYAYRKTGISDWILISAQPIAAFTDSTVAVTSRYLIWLLGIVAAGSLLYCLALKRLLRPIRALTREISQPDGAVKNELTVVIRQIARMQERERQLRSKLTDSHDSVRALYLLARLRGACWAREAPVTWAHAGFLAVVVSQDDLAERTRATTAEQLRSFDLRALEAGARLLGEVCACEAVELSGGSVAFVLNAPLQDAAALTPKIVGRLRGLRAAAGEDVPSLSAGVGGWQEGEGGLRLSHQQAVAALKQKLFLGAGSVIVWAERPPRPERYYYPAQTETRLINAIATGNRAAADEALVRLDGELRALPVENVLQVINGLIGSIVVFMMENRVDPALFEDGVQGWYAQAGNIETLDGLIDMMRGRVGQLIDGRNSAPEASRLGEIHQYIQAHFTEEIDFEAMAADVGISYSYMRRIVREQTGQSLLDLVHGCRIARAKALLSRTDLPVREIAARVGYQNQQSFNRFFKKFEGIVPSEYRAISG